MQVQDPAEIKSPTTHSTMPKKTNTAKRERSVSPVKHPVALNFIGKRMLSIAHAGTCDSYVYKLHARDLARAGKKKMPDFSSESVRVPMGS